MSNSPIYALAIVAHPDDESFLLAGTCLKFAEAGKLVRIYCATKGEKGADRQGRNLTLPQMAKIRMHELMHACDCIHCATPEFGNYPDGGLDSVNFQDLVNNLVSLIQKYQPEIILTFGEEGISGHKDHIVIGRASLAAAKIANPRPKEIWRASMPASVMPEFKKYLSARKVHHSHYQEPELKGVVDDKLMRIDIRKFSNQKRQAIQAHASQYLPQFISELFLESEYFEVITLS